MTPKRTRKQSDMILTNSPSNLSTRRDCSAGNNKSPRYPLVRKRHAHWSDAWTTPRDYSCCFYIRRIQCITMHITEFINECRGIQNAILPQEEANIILHLRSKLRIGQARKALHWQQFATIAQILDRLKSSFGIMGDISNSYAELGQLCMRNRERIIDYIDRVQAV